MKTNRFIIAALSFAAAAVSCQKEDFGGVENVRQTESATIVTGEMTRTSLSGKEIHWTSDDVIAVFDNANYKNVFNISEAEGSYASFEGSVTSGTTQIYAVYPADLAVSANGSDLKVNIPTNQTSKVGSFAEEHNISVAKGAKVPGVEAIENITFKNVCALLKFTIPSYVENVKSVNFSTSTPISGEATVDFSGDAPVLSISPNGSTNVTMTGSYPAGSEFLFVLAPGKIKGCTVTVTDNDGQTWNVVKTSTFTLEAGKYKNLGQLDVEPVAATASATHVKSGETLVGTDVTLKLNIPAVTQKHVTAVSIEIKNSAGQVVRSSSNTASTQKLSDTHGWPYLPQGTYTVSGTYTLADGKARSIAPTSFTSPAPVFKGTATVKGTTSYSIYYNNGGTKNPTDANAHAAETISEISASCPAVANISSEILEKIPVNYSITLDGSELKKGTTKSTAAIGVNDQTGQPWGQHTLAATFTFDGVAISGSTNCHVTGLPYSRLSMIENEWSFSSWNCKYSGGTMQLGGVSGSGEASATFNKSFHVPANISIKVNTNVTLGSLNFIGWVTTDFTVKVNGSNIIKQNSGKQKEKTFNLTGTSTFTPSGNSIILNSSYTLAGPWSRVNSMEILYN